MILDTNALSAVADGDPGASKAMAAAGVAAIPVIVLGEYRFGIAQSRLRLHYERWLEQGLSACRILSVDAGTTLYYAELRLDLKRAGTPIPANDAWIAALSRQHMLPVLSRDTHFDFVPGLRRISW